LKLLQFAVEPKPICSRRREAVVGIETW